MEVPNNIDANRKGKSALGKPVVFHRRNWPEFCLADNKLPAVTCMIEDPQA